MKVDLERRDDANMTLMGIDAGFAKLGWVVADMDTRAILAFDCVKTTKKSDKHGVRVADDDVRRCQHIYRALQQAHQEHEPLAWFVEIPHGGSRHSRSARTMGMGTAILACLVEDLQVPCEWLTYRSIKKAAKGKVSVSKEEVRDAMLDAWDWPSTPEYEYAKSHVYDAAACLVAAEGSNTLRLLRAALGRKP